MRKLFLLALIAVLASGCAGKMEPGYKKNPSISYASNVLLAAGSERVLDTKDGNVKTSSDGKLFDVAGGAASYFSPNSLLGLSALGDGLLSFTMLAASSPKAPERSSMFFAWLPKELAADPVAAKVLYQQSLSNAMKAALAKAELPRGFSIDLSRSRFFPIVGESECATKASRCSYAISESKPPKLGNAPNFIGDSMVWEFSYSHFSAASFNSVSYEDKGIKKARFPDLDVYLAMSKELPPWFFIYLAPPAEHNLIAFKDGETYKWLTRPVLLNQGEIYLFTRPWQ